MKRNVIETPGAPAPMAPGDSEGMDRTAAGTHHRAEGAYQPREIAPDEGGGRGP